MDAKTKAKNLVNQFYQPLGYLACQVSSQIMWDYAKDRAKETVDEILNFMDVDDLANNDCYWANHHQQVFWQSVKTEIENL